MIRCDSANILSGPANLNVIPGQYAALMVRVTGLTAAGAAPTLANFGLLTGTIDGRPFYSVPLSVTQSINSMDLGLVESAIGAAGGNPIALSAVILASRAGDGNVFDFAESDNVQIGLDLSGISAANVASGTVQLFAIPQEGVQMYLPKMFAQVPNLAASSTDIIRLQYENISHLYVITTTNVASLMIQKDRKVFLDSAMADIQAFSNMDTRTEAAFTAGFVVNFHRSGSLSESLSDDLQVSITAGAGGAATPSLVPVSLDFTPDVLARSQTLVQATAQARFDRKTALGKGRPVTVARAIAGV